MLNETNFLKDHSYASDSDKVFIDLSLYRFKNSKGLDLCVKYFSSIVISIISLGFAKV